MNTSLGNLKPLTMHKSDVTLRKEKVPLFRPFRHRTFRHLCVANFMANIGSWMQIFATGWLVASQTRDPSVAALAQTLTQIPVFLFSVMGGVLADRYATYRYLGGVNSMMFLSAAVLGGISVFSTPEISVIFLFTFLTATGTALKASGWQASMSSMVEPNEIEAAATLNGLSYNLASVIGPSLGSLLFLLAGPSILYFTHALCLASLVMIYIWMQRRDHQAVSQKRQSYSALLAEGMKVSAGNQHFRSILFTTVIVFFSVSTFQALLPAYVSLALNEDSHALGLLMSGFGCGAVISAFALPTLRSVFERHQLLGGAALIYGISLLVFSATLPMVALVPVAVVGGFSWAAIVSTFNSAAQSVFGVSVRARALSVYSMCFYGALTLGSLTWGKVSGLLTIRSAFLIAGCLMICTALYVWAARKTADENTGHNLASDLTDKR